MKKYKLDNKPKWCPYIRKQFGKVMHIYDPILRCNFYICAGVTRSKFVSEFNKLGVNIQVSEVDGNFQVIIHKGSEVGVIYSKDKTITLSHECLHASVWILNKRGIPINSETDEAMAYYQDFLYKWSTKK